MIGLLLVVASLYSLGAGAQPLGRGEPDLVKLEASVCRPVFQLDGHEDRSGTGFILRAPALLDTQVLVTAHHLFELATARDAGMRWEDTPRRVRSVVCASLAAGRRWQAGPVVAIAGVQAFRDLSEVRDVAILPITTEPQADLLLASSAPQPGDVVRLLAQSGNPLQGSVLFHRARVELERGALIYIYDNLTLGTANISGAPVVAADGGVVGVNVAAGRLQNGALVGVADDLATLQAALLAARASWVPPAILHQPGDRTSRSLEAPLPS